MVSPRIVPNVVREHAELAAFLWVQRDMRARADPPEATAIAALDARLEANLDGLRIAGAAAWPFLIGQLEEWPGAGQLFAAAVRALEEGEPRRVVQVVDFARALPDARGFVGALGWLGPSVIAPQVRPWLRSAEPFLRWLGVSALAEHRVDAGRLLPQLLADGDARVQEVAFRLAGLTGRQDAAEALTLGLEHPDETVRLWAALALTQLKARGLAPQVALVLREAAIGGGPNALTALRAAVAAGPEPEVREWLGDLYQAEDTASLAVRAVGMQGDRSRLGWIVDQMRTPALAEAAGRAFVELEPDLSADDDLWSSDAEVLGPEFTAHFDDFLPRLPVYARVAAKLGAKDLARNMGAKRS